MEPTKPKTIEIVLLFTAFIASTYGFGFYLFPAMVETVRADIGFSYSTYGTISGLVQAGFLLTALAAGFLTLQFGAIRIILASIALCALGLAGLALSTNVTMIAVCLLLLGGCAASIWVPMVEVSRDLVAAQHQGKALGLMSSGTSYGVFINSFLLTWLLPAFGWRSLWWATALFVLLLTLFALLRLRRAGVRKDGRDTASAPPKQSFHQRLARLPKGPSIAILTMMFLNGLSCMPYQTYLSAFLLAEAGYSDQMAAYAWRIMGLIGMVSGFALGALADRITVRWAMVVTYGILSLSCLTLLTSIGGQSPIFVGIAAILFGLSFYPIFGLVPAYISQVFGEGDAALIFAFGNIALGLGGMLGNMAGGWLKQSLDSFQPIYWIMLGAAIASILLSLVMRNEKEARVLAYQSNSK